MTADFDALYDQLVGRLAIAGQNRPSPELKELLSSLFTEVTRDPIQLPDLKLALISVLKYLAKPDGRTSANCKVTDWADMTFSERRTQAWSDVLPERLASVLEDMGMCLHDSVDNPEVAADFRSLPEQLLQRLQVD